MSVCQEPLPGLENPHSTSSVTLKALDKTEIYIESRQNKHAQVKETDNIPGTEIAEIP